MALFLVRHGQSIANLHTHADHRNPADVGDDSPLTDLGKLQASRIASSLASLTQTRATPLEIISSPLGRAKQTAHIICESLPNADVTLHSELSEIKVTDLDIVKAVCSARESLKEMVADLQVNCRDVRIIVAHEWILQLVLQSLLGCEKCNVWFRLANCSITQFEVDRCVRSDGRVSEGLSLVSLNSVAHLRNDQITF